MKKTFVIATIIPICIGLGNSAFGEELQQISSEKEVSPLFDVQSVDKNFAVVIGVKSWFNKWEFPIELPEAQQFISYKSKTETTFIPVLSFKYKNLFVSGSFFPKKDYSFAAQSIDLPVFTPSNQEEPSIYYIDDNQGLLGISNEASVKIPIPVSLSGERSEWDINVGYYLLPTLAVTAGYKRIKREISMHIPDDFSLTFFNQAGNTATVDANQLKQDFIEPNNKTDGLMLSITSVVPLQHQFSLYGSFAYGWLKTKGGGKTVDSKYKLGELGLLYSHRFDQMAALNAASVYFGYRFQFLNDDFSVGNGATDSTEGFVLGVNIVF